MTATSAETRRLASREVTLPARYAPSGTRGALIEAALRLFAEKGYAGTSIRDIANEAGVQSASIYGHYPSKEHILAEIVVVGHREHHARLAAAVLESGADPVDQLGALARAHVLLHAEHQMLAIVANVELHMLSPEMAAPALELRSRSEALFHDVVIRGVEVGRFAPIDTWMAIAAIAGMGVRVANWFSSELDVPAEQVADIYAAFALRIVGIHVAAPDTTDTMTRPTRK